MGRTSRTASLALCTAALAAVAAGCGGSGEGDTATTGGEERPKLRLAVTDLQGLEQLQREFGALQEALEDVAGVDIELFAVNDRVAAAAALQSDRVDLVFTGPAEYVVMKARTQATPVVAIKRQGYRVCFWTQDDSPIRTLQDLRGKKIAMSDIGSTSGHLGPSQMLAQAGLDPQEDVEIVFAGDAVQPALERGDVAAVAVGCQDYEGYLESEEERAEFPVFERGPELPPDVIVANDDVPPEVIQQVREGFQANWPALREAMLEGEDNAKYRDAELIAVPTDDTYDPVRQMYRAIGVDDFTEFVEE